MNLQSKKLSYRSWPRTRTDPKKNLPRVSSLKCLPVDAHLISRDFHVREQMYEVMPPFSKKLRRFDMKHVLTLVNEWTRFLMRKEPDKQLVTPKHCTEY